MSASTFPGTPKLLKGMLLRFEARVPIPTQLIVFQYNPDSLTRSMRSVETSSYTHSDDWTYVREQRTLRPPIESFTLSIELDASDQLETLNPLALTVGLHPTLAALDLLLYPRADDLFIQQTEEEAGMERITQSTVPSILLVLGAPRVVPVRITSMSTTEEAFDQLLNPIRARVDLGFEALSERELEGTPFEKVELVRHVAKEVLARANLVNSAMQVGGMLPL